MPVVSPPATILVTGKSTTVRASRFLPYHKGVSGFIGSHAARAYLEEGFTVRGTVRSRAKGKQLRSSFSEEFPGRFDFVIADIEDSGDIDAAVQGVDAVAHVASPVKILPPGGDPQMLIRPAVEGTLNVLRSAAKTGTVKRVVVTGSIAALSEPHEPPYTYSTSDWNDQSVRIVAELGGQAPPGKKYCASKVLAERAASAWVEDNKPNFDLCHVLPAFVFGPVLSPVSSLEDISGTPKLLIDIFADPKAAAQDMGDIPGAVVHVRDVARAHVAAHSREDLGNSSRLIVSSRTAATFQQFYDAYWSLPNAERPRLPFDVPQGEPVDAEAGKSYEFETAEEALGWKFASLTEMVRDTLGDLAPRIYNDD
ncbi:NAD(P)-binding protein [Auricularia subglabra TFB-10046 SS5]|nr:NAD(P)-binding protein [Auricularia subglabra TFB-10046 SS5]